MQVCVCAYDTSQTAVCIRYAMRTQLCDFCKQWHMFMDTNDVSKPSPYVLVPQCVKRFLFCTHGITKQTSKCHNFVERFDVCIQFTFYAVIGYVVMWYITTVKFSEIQSTLNQSAKFAGESNKHSKWWSHWFGCKRTCPCVFCIELSTSKQTSPDSDTQNVRMNNYLFIVRR